MRHIKYFYISFILLISASLTQAASIDSVQVYSTAMKKKVKALVVKPKSYANASKRFPVIYLLHAFGGDHKDWIEGLPASYLSNLADKYNLILICPDGSNSFYIDSPINKYVKYETFMISELIPWVDQKYRTSIDPKNKAITGISMGGHGALYLAIRHPEKFGAAGSMSGAIDLSLLVEEEWVSDELVKILGPYTPSNKRYKDYSLINMIPKIKDSKLPIILNCGKEDEFFIETHREFHQKLTKAQVPHEYKEGTGKHDFTYWKSVLESHLMFFEKQMKGMKEKKDLRYKT